MNSDSPVLGAAMRVFLGGGPLCLVLGATMLVFLGGGPLCLVLGAPMLVLLGGGPVYLVLVHFSFWSVQELLHARVTLRN